jgi:hypothetical protein
VHGPRCEFAHTLPAKFTLQDLGPGPTLLARATLTDPCLWTADLPQIYDVLVELKRGHELVASERRMIGLRGLGVRQTSGGPRLVRESNIWIPRGASLDPVREANLHSFRDQLLVAVCQGVPSLDLLREASLKGVYLLIKLGEFGSGSERVLQHLARWPAVMMVAYEHHQAANADLRNVAPNLLLAQSVKSSDLPQFVVAEWAQAVIVQVPEVPAPPAQTLAKIAAERPILIEGVAPASTLPDRAACDLVQRNLAPIGQFAGYLAISPTL